jgi:hypothetical protein
VERTNENRRHGREASTLAIQDHRNKDNRISSLRSIGALAFAEVQQRGENSKTTRADKRGKTGREQKNQKKRHPKPRGTFLASRIYMRAKPSPGYVRKARQAVSVR